MHYLVTFNNALDMFAKPCSHELLGRVHSHGCRNLLFHYKGGRY